MLIATAELSKVLRSGVLCHQGSFVPSQSMGWQPNETQVRLQDQSVCFCPEWWMMVFLSHSSYYLTVKQVCAGSNLIKASPHFLCNWNIRVQAFACCTAELLLWDFGAGLAQVTMTSPSVVSIVALVYLQLWRSAFCTCAWVMFKVQDVAKMSLKWSSQKHKKKLVLFCSLACHSEMSLHRRWARTGITTSAWMLFGLALSFLAHRLFILSLGRM